MILSKHKAVLTELALLLFMLAMGFGMGWVQGIEHPTAESAAIAVRNHGFFVVDDVKYQCARLTEIGDF